MKQYRMSIRCYYPGYGNYTTHYRRLGLNEIELWIQAYQYTHPECEAMTIKIYTKEDEQRENEEPGGGSDLLQPSD